MSKQEKAADRLEELAYALLRIVRLLRKGQSDEVAYTVAYVLRREIGYVVSSLGSGLPRYSLIHKAEAFVDGDARDRPKERFR